ncbi:MAG: host attachment family protein [Sphingomonadaceae bacterium]
MRIPNEALVLVADGRKMLFLRNKGDEAIVDLRVESHREQDNPPDREQATDAPGRSYSSVGSARSKMQQTNFHQLQEDRFAAEAADMLKDRALSNDFNELIIVAPPRTLGEMRKHYHKAVEARLIGEIDRDLTGMAIPTIEQTITMRN